MAADVRSTAPAVLADVPAIAGALETQVAQLADRVRRAAGLRAPVPGLAWTVQDVVAHLAVVHTSFAAALRGDDLAAVEDVVRAATADVPPTAALPARLARTNAATVGLVPVPSPGAGADLLLERGQALVTAVRQVTDPLAAVPAPWYGTTRRAGTLAALALSETLVHGWDVDRATRARRPLPEGPARLCAPVVMSEMLPLLVAPRGDSAPPVTLLMRVRGTAGFVLHLEAGAATARHPGPVRDPGDDDAWLDPTGDVDCTVTLSGRAALLVGHRRWSVLRALARGEAFAHGRAPWVALGFGSLFLAA